MEAQENSEIQAQATLLEPDGLLREFRERSESLDTRLDALQAMIQGIRSDIHSESARGLHQLAEAAADMANGRVYQKIDMEAKGELGALVQSINTTLTNLQQLDASVKQQSTQVPELAAQLDAITADTETATQAVMNRLDALMNASDESGRALGIALSALQENLDAQTRFQTRIDEFLTRANGGEDPTQVAQQVLDFLFEHQVTTRLPPVDLSKVKENLTTVSDEAFEILNTLQFQDITRQKIEKVVLLLKQFKGGLQRLLNIFKIETAETGETGEVSPDIFEHRTVATQDNIFETTMEMDNKKESVDDIIAQFKKK
jgi:chemotaxis regulatin CheY-phosphate phosphatase CheZ